jgi:hypothetical protein
MIVATQSCFHRDMLDGEQFALKPLKFHLVPNSQFVTLVCIDLQPYQTVQASERAHIMNNGGFSDAVFARVSAFLADYNQRFVAEVAIEV